MAFNKSSKQRIEQADLFKESLGISLVDQGVLKV